MNRSLRLCVVNSLRVCGAWHICVCMLGSQWLRYNRRLASGCGTNGSRAGCRQALPAATRAPPAMRRRSQIKVCAPCQHCLALTHGSMVLYRTAQEFIACKGHTCS